MSPCCGKSLSDLSPSNKMLNVQFFHKILSCFQVFHYAGHLTYGAVDLVGSLQIPTFFLLSGFCLSLGINIFLVIKLYPKSLYFNKFF